MGARHALRRIIHGLRIGRIARRGDDAAAAQRYRALECGTHPLTIAALRIKRGKARHALQRCIVDDPLHILIEREGQQMNAGPANRTV